MMTRLFAVLVTSALLLSFGCAQQPASTQSSVLDPMPQRAGLVTLRDKPLTLLGEPIQVGDQAGGITLVANDMSEVGLEAYRGKTVIVSVVPSIDTGVCATQTRTFNEQAAALGQDVVILTVSMDLPMAQKRFCAAEGIEQVITLSDYRYWDLGLSWGLRIKESGLLARSIFVVDAQGVVRYAQIVPELTTEPDYAAALAAAKTLAG